MNDEMQFLIGSLIALCLASIVSAHAQSPEVRPSIDFWPHEVTISKEVALEKRSRYGSVLLKRPAGTLVKVVRLDSDLLAIEADGFLGKIEVQETDFWERAGKASDAAMEQRRRDEEAMKVRDAEEAAARARNAAIQRYKNAEQLEFKITQVLPNGCLAAVWDWNSALKASFPTGKRIFIELTGPGLAEGQKYGLHAERSGTFSYKTVLGAPSTVERWTPVEP
jgi:hypothetical protein